MYVCSFCHKLDFAKLINDNYDPLISSEAMKRGIYFIKKKITLFVSILTFLTSALLFNVMKRR